jgi:methyl-accepting chemotaxis protein
MKWLANLTVFKKLAVSALISIALTVTVGVFALDQIDKVNQTSTDMELNWMPSAVLTGAMNTNTSDFRVAELQHILSTDDAEMATYEKAMAQVETEFKKNQSSYVKLISSPQEQALYDAFLKNWSEYMSEHKRVLELSRANKNDDAKALIRGNSQKQFNEASDDLTKLIDLNVEGGKQASHDGDALFGRARLSILALLVTAIVVGLGIATLIANMVSAPLRQAVTVARQVAAGDLTAEYDVASRDETGQLMQALKDMIGSLRHIVGEVRTSTDMIATASTQIASGNLDLSARTEQQASSLEETASSMEELTGTVRQNADNARQANQLAASASGVAIKGGAVVSQVVDTMTSINDSARKIVDIISVIDGIAFQTNILALNAAVEAARAGEQGRGFAVVASEVRNLAQRSASAAKEIKTLIDDSVEKVGVGSRLVGQAGATMSDVVESVKRVSDVISEIASASQEQSSGVEQINQAITQMDEVVQQNAALVEQAAAAAGSLQDQAGHLVDVVAVFRTNAMLAARQASARLAAPAPSARGPRPVSGKAAPRKQVANASPSDEFEEF